MKNLFVYILLISSVLFACGNEDSSENAGNAKSEKEMIVPVDSSKNSLKEGMKMADKGKAETARIECTGRVEAPPQSLVSVHARAEGYVSKVRFLIGDFVPKGTLLATIENPDFAIRQQKYLEAKAQFTFAKKDWERKKELEKTKSIPDKTMEEATQKMEVAQANWLGVQSELKMIGFNLARLDSGSLHTSLNIYSPVSGYISNININLGKRISSTDLLYELIDTQHLHIELQVFTADALKIKKGQAFTFSMPNVAQVFKATVHSIASQVSANSGTVIVHGHLVNDKEASKLLVGAYLTAVFE